jgi:predicted Ser/Thr protein kinase/ActR/RegA family two-component response regulator
MAPIIDHTAKLDPASAKRDPRPARSAARPSHLCLVVHDDLELRLKLAGVVRRTAVKLDADTLTESGLASLSIDQLRSYVAVLLIIEFMQRDGGADPLGIVTRLRARMPRLPIFVFARHGDERSAARAIKAGAADYWPIHSVDLVELTAALQPLLSPLRGAAVASVSDVQDVPEVAGYQVLKKIAHSAAATVYLARSDDLAQSVALKIQHIDGKANITDEDRQRFSRECAILSSLNHRSIADVIDYGMTVKCLYLAMEYFPCGSMRERLRNPVSEADAVNYARQIAEALQLVHSAGIVHRDLKPSNLMLSTDNRVVLIDFGSARARLVTHELSISDPMTGSPYYACPEQIDGNEPDHRGDLYSLGVVLYEMLAGSLPFLGSSVAEIFNGHRLAAVPPLPEALKRYQPVVNRLLAKKPANRYPSAAHFLQELETVAEPTAQKRRRTAQNGALNT